MTATTSNIAVTSSQSESGLPNNRVPALTADQVREVDRLMISEFHIELEQMMENAGRALAELVIRVFGARSIAVLAGPGGNGGGGLVAARHLINRGRDVRVVLATPMPEMSPVTARQLDILPRMEADFHVPTDAPGRVTMSGLAEVDLVVDALLGYSLTGQPRGLAVTTGIAADPCVRATTTMTLALPKVGLLNADEVGDLYLADISVPRAVYHRMGIDPGSLFTDDSIVPVGN